MHSACPVYGRSVKVFLMVGRVLLLLKICLRALCFLCKDVLMFEPFSLHIMQLIKPIIFISWILLCWRKEFRVGSFYNVFVNDVTHPHSLIIVSIVYTENVHHLLLTVRWLMSRINALPIKSMRVVEILLILWIHLHIFPPRKTPSAWHKMQAWFF